MDDSLAGFIKEINGTFDIDLSNLSNYPKINNVLRFLQAKRENPNLTKRQICKSINLSESTLRRNQIDLNIKSFYRHQIPSKKTYKRESKAHDKHYDQNKVDNLIKKSKSNKKVRPTAGQDDDFKSIMENV